MGNKAGFLSNWRGTFGGNQVLRWIERFLILRTCLLIVLTPKMAIQKDFLEQWSHLEKITDTYTVHMSFTLYIYIHIHINIYTYIYIHMMYVYFTWEPMGDFLLRYQGSKDNCIEGRSEAFVGWRTFLFRMALSLKSMGQWGNMNRKLPNECSFSNYNLRVASETANLVV